RPPMGFKTRHIAAAAKALRLPIIGWSIRGFDARPTTAERLAKRVLGRASGHDILLLHDGLDPTRAAQANATQAHTVAALPVILEGIRDNRLRIVPLLEALTAPAPAEPATATIQPQGGA